MRSAQQRLWACLLVILASSTIYVQCQTAHVQVAAAVTAIQNAINALPDGNPSATRVIDIAAGVVEFGTSALVLNKLGVTLKGAGPGQTIFQTSVTTLAPAGGCADQLSGIPLLQLCPTTVNAAPNVPMIIEGITFKNNNPSFFTAGAEKGIGIYNSPGPSASNPSIIRNCEFLNLWRPTGPTGVGIEIANSNPANSNWLIQENTFDSTRQGVFVNQNSRITITQNSFTRFWTGVRQSSSDVSTDLTITSNSFIGGWEPSVPLEGVQAIALSGAAATANQDKKWLIQNNKITGVNTALEIRWPSSGSPPPASMNGVVISTNSIDKANFRCSSTYPCYNILNASPAAPPAADNWWGASPPDPSKFSPNTGTSAPVIEPWITSFVPGTCPTGFCPSDVITNDMVVPIITSVVASPSLVSAGQTIAVSVTLQAPIAYGSLSIISTPTGIICASQSIAGAGNPIVAACTAPVAGTAAMAAAAQAVHQSAAVQVAAVSGAPGEQQAAVAWRREPPTPTRQYRLTATVTADRTATRDATVTVCQNMPWPVRVEANGCQQCSYNCATAVLACTSCACHCPKEEHTDYAHDGRADVNKGGQPYPGHGDNLEEHKPYMEEKEREEHYAINRHDDGKNEDRQYGGAAPGSHKEELQFEERPYGDKAADSYKEAAQGDRPAYAHKEERKYAEGRDVNRREHGGAGEKSVYEDRPYAGKGHDNSARNDDGPHRTQYADRAADAMPEYEGKHADNGAKGSGYADQYSDWSGMFGPYSNRVPADKTSVDAETAKPDSVVNAVVEEAMRYYKASLRPEARPSSEDATVEPANVKGSVRDTETMAQYPARPANRNGAGDQKGRVDVNEGSASDSKAISEVAVQTAGLWHPLISDYGSGYGPYDSSEPRVCDSAAEKMCMCGPPALTVVAGCDKITYDSCENILQCSSARNY